MNTGPAPANNPALETSARLLAGGRVVTPEGVLSPGWIRLAGSRIDAIGPGEPPAEPGLPVTSLRGRWVLPGFVDMHVHGGGGASFTAGTAEDARRAAEFHRQNGTTTMLASLVTAPLADLEARAAMLAMTSLATRTAPRVAVSPIRAAYARST